MQKIIFLLIAIGLCLGSITAQTYFSKRTVSTVEQISVNDTVRILAVLADFPEDKDATTFGNGKFGSIYSKDYGQSILDPLPHDHDYFSHHLEFAKNYYNKVSAGRVIILYDILPGLVTVSKTMRNYSPPNNTENLNALGVFSKEVWQKADSLNPDVNFSEYDVFTIFHAGVGRDISLPGSFGNEKDLPSVYLSDNALRSMFNNDVNGLPLNRSGKVNSMIIPETESRELDVIGGVSLVEISINGLIVANIASHLGLPDLFDTNTGLSAIGRLGLMDGQAIFAYNGLFPPEPSPWEKMYLGWINPVEVRAGGNFSLLARGTTQGSDTPVIKIPINSSEYYLVENRNRDAKNDGAIITYVSGGQTHTRTFPKDTTGFFSYDVDSISGVVIDVDDYDWALPGNGILIWHIDENVIRQNIADNKINANKFRRGVDVEEADGIQDIGEKFFTIFGDEVIGEGTEEDFWYQGNKADLYKNRFDGKSIPSTTSNTGANSLISLNDFSSSGSTMSFKLSIGDSLITVNSVFDLQGNASDLKVSDRMKYVVDGTDLLLYPPSGEVDQFYENFTHLTPALVHYNNEEYVIGNYGNFLRVLRLSDFSNNTVILSNLITAPPVVSQNGEIILGMGNGDIIYYSLEGILSSPQLLKIEKTGSTKSIRQLTVSGDYTAALKYGEGDLVSDPPEYEIADNSGNILFRNQKTLPKKISILNKGSERYIVVLDTDNTFNVIGQNSTNTLKIESTGSITSFSIADLKQNGEPSIIFNEGNNLRAINLVGAGLADFPFADTAHTGFTGTPLIVDYNGDKSLEILTYTNDGRIYLISSNGNKLDGFPVSTGDTLVTDPVLSISDGALSINAISGQRLYSWKVASSNPLLYWSEEFGSSTNQTNALTAPLSNPITEFFPKERAYNWPNPVYEDFTNIRYYVSEDSRMNIKIFDLAGDFVAELNQEARGGFDNELRWDVTSIQSGVYLARIEASGVSGKNENTIIKIAVVK